MRDNNKGVSLIELVVSIGIMSLVLAIATGMIISASNYFERQASNIEMQNEAQIITNYLTETIMEATDINFTITDASTGAGVFEFYEKDADDKATGKGSQRVLHYYPDVATGKYYLYMASFDKGSVAPTVAYGDESARMYLISDEITEFKVSFDYGEEASPDTVADPAGDMTVDSTKVYVVKNPLRVKIEFTIKHGKATGKFEVIADCRNILDDVTYTKSGTTTTMKAYNR